MEDGDKFKQLDDFESKPHSSIPLNRLLGIIGEMPITNKDSWSAELEKEDLRLAYFAISKEIKEKITNQAYIKKLLVDTNGRIGVTVGGIYASSVDMAPQFDGVYIFSNSKLTVTVTLHTSKKPVVPK